MSENGHYPKPEAEKVELEESGSYATAFLTRFPGGQWQVDKIVSTQVGLIRDSEGHPCNTIEEATEVARQLWLARLLPR